MTNNIVINDKSQDKNKKEIKKRTGFEAIGIKPFKVDVRQLDSSPVS
jgi:hypothetical protein